MPNNTKKECIYCKDEEPSLMSNAIDNEKLWRDHQYHNQTLKDKNKEECNCGYGESSYKDWRVYGHDKACRKYTQNKEEVCGICTQNIDEKGRCSLDKDLILCPIHPTSEPFNKFSGRCKWCYSQMHPEYPSPQSTLSEENCICGRKKHEWTCKPYVDDVISPSSNEDWATELREYFDATMIDKFENIIKLHQKNLEEDYERLDGIDRGANLWLRSCTSFLVENIKSFKKRYEITTTAGNGSTFTS